MSGIEESTSKTLSSIEESTSKTSSYESTHDSGTKMSVITEASKRASITGAQKIGSNHILKSRSSHYSKLDEDFGKNHAKVARSSTDSL